MPELNLKDVNVVLLEHDRQIRLLVKSALQGMGFGLVNESRNVNQGRELIARVGPDLLILDFDFDCAPVCDIIRDVRYERLGANPFVVIIGLTGRAETPLVQEALRSGSDDVVTKPISAQLLTERIVNLVQNRKDFIATTDYVGPRRSDRAPISEGPAAHLAVPNSLRQKAMNEPAGGGDATIKRAAQTLGLQRLYGVALDVVARAAHLEELAAADACGNGFMGELRELSTLVDQVADVGLPGNLPNLKRLADSLAQVMAATQRAAAPSAREFAVLRLHAQAIAATMRGDVGASNVVAAALGEAVAKVGGEP